MYLRPFKQNNFDPGLVNNLHVKGFGATEALGLEMCQDLQVSELLASLHYSLN